MRQCQGCDAYPTSPWVLLDSDDEGNVTGEIPGTWCRSCAEKMYEYASQPAR